MPGSSTSAPAPVSAEGHSRAWPEGSARPNLVGPWTFGNHDVRLCRATGDPPKMTVTIRVMLTRRGPTEQKEPRNEAQDPRHHVQRGRSRARRAAAGDG